MAGLLGQRKFSGQFQRADGQGRSRERNSCGRPEIISRLNRGLAARVGHRHARLTWLTAASHLLAALFLFGGKLGVRSDAGHDGPSEQDHSQKGHENGATAHKLRLPSPRLGWQDVHATWMPIPEKGFSRFRLRVVMKERALRRGRLHLQGNDSAKIENSAAQCFGYPSRRT